MTYACPAWEFAADNHLLKLQRLQNKISPHHWKFSKVPTSSRFAYDFQTSILYKLYIYYITKLCRQQAEVVQNQENVNVRNIEQGEPRHRKYKWLKLGGGQAYDRSSK
jgi:hypothetical protein